MDGDVATTGTVATIGAQRPQDQRGTRPLSFAIDAAEQMGLACWYRQRLAVTKATIPAGLSDDQPSLEPRHRLR